MLHLLSRKTVSFDLPQYLTLIPSLLASSRSAACGTTSLEANQNSKSSKWCLLADHIRTHFSNQT
jgi:hypothetical protein